MMECEDIFSVFPTCVLSKHILKPFVESTRGRGFKTARLVSRKWYRLVNENHPNGDVEFANFSKTLISKYGLNNTLDFTSRVIKNGIMYCSKNLEPQNVSEFLVAYRLRAIDSHPREASFYLSIIGQIVKSGDGKAMLIAVNNLVHHNIWIGGIQMEKSVRLLCERTLGTRPIQPKYIRIAKRIIRIYDHKTSIEELFLKKEVDSHTINSHPQLTMSFVVKHLDYDWNPMMFSYESGLIKFSDVYNKNREMVVPFKNRKYTFDQVLGKYCSCGLEVLKGILLSRKNIERLFFNTRIPWNDLMSVCHKKMWILNRLIRNNLGVLSRTDIPLDILLRLRGGLSNEQRLYYAYSDGMYSWKDITKNVWKKHQDTILTNVSHITSFETPK